MGTVCAYTVEDHLSSIGRDAIQRPEVTNGGQLRKERYMCVDDRHVGDGSHVNVEKPMPKRIVCPDKDSDLGNVERRQIKIARVGLVDPEVEVVP
jgi:hypothetical protein